MCRIGFLTLVLLGLLATLGVSQAVAQERASICLAIAENQLPGPRILKANWNPVPVQAANETVTITYISHSTFRIESPGGVIIATDYSGNPGPGRTPDVVTMNHAHATHYTDFPDPAIPHVLRGWNPQAMGDGSRAEHHLQISDTYIRNVSTDIYGQGRLAETNGNSIFIFEMAGLCIGHLGHLHHTLTPEHYAAIGRLDVLMIPVDGSYTMSQESMAEIAERLRASIILPMHYFSSFSLERWVERMGGKFDTTMTTDKSIQVSLRTLPDQPKVIAIQLY